MTVNRFKPIASVAISLSENGEYVRYEDYIALMDELEDVRKRTEELEEIASYYGLKLKKAQIALKFAALRHKNSSKRIAELETRAIELPPAWWVRQGKAPEFLAYPINLVIDAIRAAGIGVKGA
ncbi:hypothetical protein FGS43_04420 [Salmonella enterica]|nr:hypothetical protein [Salmonella enterica]EDT0678062.1 hypothetical protein [Salmonella enterica subsp. enterica serovar Urbana]EEL6963211.1 hypothetical protein [Salmonella enterica subsp. enterica serovar Muenchen]EAM7934885.1 hypothetical protein [Salmonella enterica]EAM8751696.1 hypothetical protein [Salmonella enterica]